MSQKFELQCPRFALFPALLAAGQRHGMSKVILEDHERQALTYKRLILASLILGRELSRKVGRNQNVGILLPNVNGLVVALFGLNAFGHTVGLLNFTAGIRNLISAVKMGPLPFVVTSRKFVETAQLSDAVSALAETEVAPGRKVSVIYLEDVRKGLGIAAKLKGLLTSVFAPWCWRKSAIDPDKPAVILFTSGTESVPKGVVLSNTNIVANSAQIFAHAEGMLSPADTVMNPLPIFHSFGLTAATMMPLLNGLKVVLYPSPLHYKQIPKMIGATQSTILFATDTFLQGYARFAEQRDLASIRFVIAGAERVKDQTRQQWQPTVILEGYGATECSPVISCNLPQANRPGSVGRLLPGIEARIEPVAGIAAGGRLFVRGCNVMTGYLFADKPGVLVPPAGGWHDTGDIVTIEDGFLSIAGRAKRFAKIGGEMISLAAIERICADLWPDADHVVVNLPDPKKGEALVLVTTEQRASREALLAFAKMQGMAELSVPRSILIVDAIPVLGTGKVDFQATQALAKSRLA